MHKLLILIEEVENQTNFDELWPKFLRLAEQMPGLQREVSSRVERVLFGKSACSMIHELHFDTLEALRQALNSVQGQQAGQMLQKLTQGRLTLMIAEHKEDDLVNISQYRTPKEEEKGAT